MELNLRGKTAVITGGATGMGLETALLLGEEGCRIALCGRRPEKLSEAKSLLEERGVPVYCQTADMTEEEQVNRFADRAAEALGGIDIWINNAGMAVHKPMMEISAAHWKQLIDANLTSVFYGCKAAARHMWDKGGVILNAGSFQSLFPAAGSGPYGAAKAGVCSLTRTFAGELASRGIRVVTYIPGVIETPMAKLDDWMTATNQQANIPLPRLGTTSDIANTLVFLASDKASYINGVSVEITGGKFCVQNPRYSWE